MQRLNAISAAGFDARVLEAEYLVSRLTDSSDLPKDVGMEGFCNLMIMKYMELPEELILDLELVGIDNPLRIMVLDDGGWMITDGHHRLAWALVAAAPVPLCLIYPDTDMIDLYETIEDVCGEDRYFSYTLVAQPAA